MWEEDIYDIPLGQGSTGTKLTCVSSWQEQAGGLIS